MKNIRNIFRYDLHRVTASVVAIVTVMGLCIVPCLYAWFNIFSNWAPYDADATSRIAVAVASEDEGAEMLGLTLNVGDKIIDALEANDAIGWVFLDSGDDAIEGVYAGDYYAALIVPKDFSENVLSFMSGELQNPQLLYYENEKKNAIAPKITGKAKTAVQEQVNATFVQTLATYVSGAVSVANASGYNPQEVFANLSERTALLSERLDNCMVMLDAAAGLSNAAQSLITVSDRLIGDAQSTVSASQDLLDTTAAGLPDASSAVTGTADAVRQVTAQVGANLDTLSADVTNAFGDAESYNDFLATDLASRKALIDATQQSVDMVAAHLSSLGLTTLASRFEAVSQKLGSISEKLGKLGTADETTWAEVQDVRDTILGEIADARALITAIGTDVTDDLDTKLQSAITDAQNAVGSVRQSLSGFGGELVTLSGILSGYSDALGALQGGLTGTRATLQSLQQGIKVISGVLDRLAENDALADVNGILSDDTETVASYLASPVKMATEVIYPVREYGSAMAPFYTVLAQWVGSLLAAVLIKVKVHEREGLGKTRVYERFFGRYGLFLLVGLAQALIVSLGDLLYVGIQCPHPVQFVLAACVNGVAFTMINYALVFALDNIGLALGVIILVIQVAGAGGTYPVEVLPEIFQKLNPAMPFRYAMDAMRECVAGMYGSTYAACLGALGLFILGAIVFGLAVYRPALWLNRLIAESKKKSEIML